MNKDCINFPNIITTCAYYQTQNNIRYISLFSRNNGKNK